MASRKRKASYTVKVVKGLGWKAATIKRTTSTAAKRAARHLSKRAGESCVFHKKRLVVCYRAGEKVTNPFAGAPSRAGRRGASPVCEYGEGGPDCLPL